jgi:hypothetical protein
MWKPGNNTNWLLGLAAVVGLCAAGCSLWHVPKLDVNKYRDPRAVDIDDRLGTAPPVLSAPQ